jgi:hypothetical protein
MYPFTVEGESMSVLSITPSLQRPRSALDHRGSDLAARLLVARIWLERQFENAPELQTTLPMESGPYGLTAKVSRGSVLTPHELLSEVQ